MDTEFREVWGCDQELCIGFPELGGCDSPKCRKNETAQETNSAWRKGALLAILPAVLPALLAALHGLSMQAEFERLAERSEAMSEHLKRTADRFAQLSPSSIDNFGVVIEQRAVDIARTMLEEVLDWRVIYLGHSTELA